MTLFGTALRQQRLALTVWGVGLGLMVVAVVGAAPAVTHTDISAFMAALPQAWQQLMNMELMLGRPLDGYLYMKLFMYLPLLVGIYAAFQVAGMVAREVEGRQMDFVLSLPVSRAALLWSRLQAIWTGSALLWLFTLAVLYLALQQSGYAGDWTGYLLASWIGLLLAAALAALAAWATAGASDYRRAVRSGLGLVVTLFLADLALMMSGGNPAWRRLLLYGLYNPPDLLLHHRFPWLETAVLVAVIAAATGLAMRTFDRREV